MDLKEIAAEAKDGGAEEEEFNLEREILHDVAKRGRQLDTPNSSYEAYAMLQDLKEKADKAGSGAGTLFKELWQAVCDKDSTVFSAYVGQLATEARNTAIAYANLAALAMTSEDIE